MEAVMEENQLPDLLNHGTHAEIEAYVASQHDVDIAEYLSQLEPEQAIEVLDMLEPLQQAQIIDYCPLEFRLMLAEALGAKRLAELMNLMSHDERADMLKALPDDLTTKTLQAMARAEREDIKRLVSYPEGSTGAIMTTDYVTIRPEQTVQEAIAKLRREAPDRETINRAYIINEARHLLGSVRLQTLILSSPNAVIEDIMEPHTQAVEIDDTQRYVAEQIAKYDVIALPVVDHDQRLVGIVTYDDAMDVITEETTEDFHKSATVGKLSGTLKQASGWMLYRKRIFWLVLLVFGNIFSGAGIAYFEETINAYVALLFFLPLLVGSGGNAGSQSATLMVRALATGDVVMRDWGRMLGRELLVATALGLTMAAAVSVIGVIRSGTEIALVVASAMVCVVLIGSLLGTSLPFILNRLKLDPATASAPLITTMADSAGVIIYFSIASALLMPGN